MIMRNILLEILEIFYYSYPQYINIYKSYFKKNLNYYRLYKLYIGHKNYEENLDNQYYVGIDIYTSILFDKYLATPSFYSYWVINFKK